LVEELENISWTQDVYLKKPHLISEAFIILLVYKFIIRF
jgi:hypothetical protein